MPGAANARLPVGVDDDVAGEPSPKSNRYEVMVLSASDDELASKVSACGFWRRRRNWRGAETLTV